MSKSKFFSWEVRWPFKVAFFVTVVLASLVLLSGCGDGSAPTTKVTQSMKAAQAAEAIAFTENAEIDNIKKRLTLTSDPGLTGYILLLNEMGQPIMYTGVVGKVTSGGKRLTAPIKVWGGIDCGQYCDEMLGDAPSDEGTWGSSNPYVYFWTTTGQYIQWNGKYLYSDQPFRTNVEPLVIITQ